MVRGLYIAATGMNVQSKKMDIVSNDLANVNTTGYKKDTAVIAAFPEILTSKIDKMSGDSQVATPIGTMNFGARVDEVYTQFSQGSLIKTEGIVDVAIQGTGFLTIQTPEGLSYTRDGQFSINPNGDLVTKEGYAVMGQDGPINLGEDFLADGAEVSVEANGDILLGEEWMDQLALVDFEDTRTLLKAGDNLYTATADPIAFEGSVIQGFIEGSNVNPVTAMVDMITVSRAYEANQKMIQTQDTLLGKAVNDIARV